MGILGNELYTCSGDIFAPYAPASLQNTLTLDFRIARSARFYCRNISNKSYLAEEVVLQVLFQVFFEGGDQKELKGSLMLRRVSPRLRHPGVRV